MTSLPLLIFWGITTIGGNQAFAAGIDAGLDWAAQKAATLGRTAAEAQELVQTVKKTGEVALTAMALTGLKKDVRAVRAPKPALVAAHRKRW